MIKIDGVSLPISVEYLISILDLSKAERTANGNMTIERIATKRKLELAWKHLSQQQLSQLLNLVEPVFFQVEYPDPQDDTIRTGTFYCGDRTIGALGYVNGQVRWRDIKFNLIEK